MTKLRNTLLLDALDCRNDGRPPVWLMRQAGRYLPTYQQLRSRYSFFELCHQPELAALVTQLPLQEYHFDAAILFSDILILLEAFGIKVDIVERKGPVIANPVRTFEHIQTLNFQDVRHSLGFVRETIKILLEELSVPLIGFAGGPFTVASYLVEGGSSQHHLIKRFLFSSRDQCHQLLSKITEATIEYLKMQIEAGVHVIQIFDSWAGVLPHSFFLEYCSIYIRRILDKLQPYGVPIILFTRGTHHVIKNIASLNPIAIGLDWQTNLKNIRNHLSYPIAIQGNLDPDLLFAPKEMIKQEVEEILFTMHGDKGYIFNLGHGILPETPLDSVHTLLETIHEFPYEHRPISHQVSARCFR